ncbi:hypothetical protein B0H19DRAFT_953952 [Mycena capillaripes]|nr:hypothetical protein B0H19DRAFT_953952 [Mycena capillaripes]
MSSYVVTGAARGIGFEFVKQLSADSGNAVFAIVRNKGTATQLNSLSRKNVTVLETDITDAKALKLAASAVSNVTGGKLDYLINNTAKFNNAGFTLEQYPTPEAVEDELIDSFRTNAVGVVHTINVFLPLFKKGSTKKVITISTGIADPDYTVMREYTALPSYSISKATLNMVVAKYAAQFKAEGFVFLALSPGLVNTRVSPPTAQELEDYKKMTEAILKVAPHFKGPITPEESVKMQLEVINRWTVEETGAFVSHYGNKQWV